MSQSRMYRMDELATSLVKEYLAAGVANYENFVKLAQNGVELDEYAVVLVYRVDKLAGAQKAAARTPRSQIDYCKACGKPL